MNEHPLSCVVIQQNTHQQQRLLLALRAAHSDIDIELAGDLSALKTLLARSPLLLFYAMADNDVVSRRQQHALLRLLQRLAYDCVLVCLTDQAWQALTPLKLPNKGMAAYAEVCTIATGDSTQLRQQLDYLLAYVQLKAKFRQCKHLLRIAELRSRWLVDYSREAIAYLAANQHLHVNVAYRSLFGFYSAAEAQAMDVLNLVQFEHRAIFTAFSREAEQHNRPSNKLLLTLKAVRNQDNALFRAEIRCIPAVYHGQRCLRLHVSPLVPAEQRKRVARAGAMERPNPWQEPSVSACQLPQHIHHQALGMDSLPAKSYSAALQQLQPMFNELLNLQGVDRPALLWARPWAQDTPTTRLDYAWLVANAPDEGARFQLDRRNLRATLHYLSAQKEAPALQQVVVSLGRWALTDAGQVASLLTLLKQQAALSNQLVLGVDSRVCLSHPKRVQPLLARYQAAGVTLMFEGVHHVDAPLLALLAPFKGCLVEAHASHAHAINTETGIPATLQTLLQQMSRRGVVTVVSGVQHIEVLNLLCATSAAYLQGPLLARLRARQGQSQ